MLDLCLLGCGGMMPRPKRWLTALMTNRCDLLYTLSWRSYQWAAGASSYYGKCRSDGTAYACRA